MPNQTLRHRLKTTLLLLIFLIGSGTALRLAFEANDQQTPILPPQAAQKNIERWLQLNQEQLIQRSPISRITPLQQIYRNANYRMLWFNGYELSQNGKLLLQQLLESSADELLDYQYHLAYIQQRLHNLQTLPREVTALDLLITDAFINYVLDVMNGNLLSSTRPNAQNPALKQVTLNPAPRAITTNRLEPTAQHRVVALLKNNNTPDKLHTVLQGLAPQHPEYLRLREAFSRYQKLVSDNQWPSIAGGPSLQLGDRDPQVEQLREQLQLHGDFLPSGGDQQDTLQIQSPLDQNNNDLFDIELEMALKRFQARHGSKIDGVMGRQTRALLNTAPNVRVRQIALNMKRWRELPRNLGQRYIWVNMTDYTLQLVNQGEVELNMRVIIGKEYRKTPVMSKNIHSIVINPHWNVPRRIALHDLLPQIKKDPEYLNRKRFKLFKNWRDPAPVDSTSIDWQRMSRSHFPYRLQQQPGVGNALGRIKFVIPNDQSIYLHDTSQPDLFNRNKRTLSSGCVRVEKPFALANALLHGSNNWPSERIQRILRQQKTRHIKLPRPVPTYLFYQTVWVADDNTIHFRDDIYQGDDVVHSRLQQAISL